ncbi:hypothetical protein QE152_g38800 [Popillia japonica]|uniref:Uncharacterized protein n=1 Tax=Popillia japonica TaxID=7064 RepID=A0AAW1HWA8_POPJA
MKLRNLFSLKSLFEGYLLSYLAIPVIMPLSVDQEKFLLEGYFRSGECDPNGQWKYSTRSCIDHLTTEFPNIDLDYESLSRHVLRTVERFRNTGSLSKRKALAVGQFLMLWP